MTYLPIDVEVSRKGIHYCFQSNVMVHNRESKDSDARRGCWWRELEKSKTKKTKIVSKGKTQSNGGEVLRCQPTKSYN